MAVYSRFFRESTRSFFLFGPRGTGKSTLIRARYPHAVWIDLLRPDTLRRYVGHPERLYEAAEGLVSGTIVIDEVQKVPALLSVVHSLIEEKKKIQFVLTGSSARKLKRTGADLLAGRASMRTLHPLMAAEMGKDFSLNDTLQRGLIPLIVNDPEPQEALQAYIHLYLNEEIQAEGLIRNVESFSRFLEVISFSHGSLLNISNIGRECEVKRKTVENYITILEDLLLAYQLPVFSKRAKRALSTHPKFYFFDTGVFTALRPQGPLDRSEEREGVALEGLVAQHLRAWIDYQIDKYTLNFWRTRSGVEVDFIIYGKDLWAIEVKNSRNVSSIDLKALETFLGDYPMAKALFLYRGDEILKKGKILCVPCEFFLQQLKPDQALWDAL